MRQDLILLPGLICDARLFTPQVVALADIARPFVPHLDASSVGGMAEAVLGVAPKTFALAGLSMGGYVAQEIMRQAPERVERLALISTTARPDAPEQSAMRRNLIELAKSHRYAQVMPRLLPKLISAGRRDDVDLRRVVVEMADAVGGRRCSSTSSRRSSRAPIAAPTLAGSRCRRR